MQTFLPYSNFQKSAEVLDWRRLGKQRVEGMQIINTICSHAEEIYYDNILMGTEPGVA